MNKDVSTKDFVGIRKSLEGYSLGELEAQILDIIWTLEPPITSSMVFKVMYPLRELSYSTIMLTMSKLAKKGFLEQSKSGPNKTDAFLYAVKITREQLGGKLMEQVSLQIFHKTLIDAINSLAK
ncbi:MAG: BlaI/MecI/CopY family transcriptional regulator [Armatimonadota bacterium]